MLEMLAMPLTIEAVILITLQIAASKTPRIKRPDGETVFIVALVVLCGIVLHEAYGFGLNDESVSKSLIFGGLLTLALSIALWIGLWANDLRNDPRMQQKARARNC